MIPHSIIANFLRDHMASHHTKKVMKPNLLQCSSCLQEFPNQDDLKKHNTDFDCSIRCPDCLEIFQTKAMRRDHQKERHMEAKESNFMEINEVMSKNIKERLKAYNNSLKKGKTPIDAELDQWVDANTARYNVGRHLANPKLELGQWYTIFRVLASNGTVSEHPCKKPTSPNMGLLLRNPLVYDYGIPPSEYIEERILLINDNVVESRIKVH